MNLNELISELDEELNGRKGLFKSRVDLTRCIELFEEIKRMLPPSLTEADLVVKSRLRISLKRLKSALSICRKAQTCLKLPRSKAEKR